MLNKIRDIKTKIFKGNSVWLLFICLFVFTSRLYFSTRIDLGRDDLGFFVVAQDVADGGIPYVTSWDHKGPLLYFILAPVIVLFGNSIFALRIFTTFYILVSIISVYFIAKRLFEGKTCLIPPLIYGLFFTSGNFNTKMSSAEILMMLPAIIAILCFINYMQNKKYPYMSLILCGFFSAAGIFIKATALFTVSICPVILILKKIRIRQYTWNVFLKELFCYTFGGLIISVFFVSYYAFHNSLPEFYHGFYEFNSKYVNFRSAGEGIRKLLKFLYRIIRKRNDFVTVLALVSLTLISLKKGYTSKQKNIAYFVIGLTLLSLLGVYWPKYMWDMYFIQMGLAFSLLIAFAISLLNINITGFNLKKSHAVIGILLSIVTIVDVAGFSNNYKHKNQEEKILYKISDYIATNTKKDETIFVLGGSNSIYFLSKRKAPTKYFHWPFHHGKKGEILQIKDATLKILSENKPKYFAYLKASRKVEYLEKFMLDNYHVEKRFNDYILYKVKEENRAE
ncbi:MAG: glycosyltransferase family 39 protein [Deltaproteobacteria bacterium]|nr:glycosyltransferase family 39 protein [Deltaproteobacteria bacterium]